MSYLMKDDVTNELNVGFIAEDTEELLSGKDHNRMMMGNAIGLLIKSVQELDYRLTKLEKKYGD